MKKLLLLLMALPFIATAQQAPKSNNPLNSSATNFQHPLSFQVEAGTQGVGGDFRYGFLPQLSARLGASFIPVTYNSNLAISGFTTDYSASAKFSNVHLLADYVPFKKMGGLRLVGGLGYLFNGTTGLNLTPTGNYTFGNYHFTSADIGQLNMDVSWKGVAPYLGVGLFRSFPSQLFNFNLDLGTYYLTAPSTHIVGTNLLDDNNQLEPQFNENLKDYRWLPVLQLNFNFKLK